MKEFVKRILKEKEELDIKLTNLENFMNTENKYASISPIEKELLERQFKHMVGYSSILEIRIRHYLKGE